MASAGHLEALTAKKTALDHQIRELEKCPSMSATLLRRLKSQKLKIKDEIEEHRRHA